LTSETVTESATAANLLWDGDAGGDREGDATGVNVADATKTSDSVNATVRRAGVVGPNPLEPRTTGDRNNREFRKAGVLLKTKLSGMIHVLSKVRLPIKKTDSPKNMPCVDRERKIFEASKALEEEKVERVKFADEVSVDTGKASEQRKMSDVHLSEACSAEERKFSENATDVCPRPKTGLAGPSILAASPGLSKMPEPSKSRDFSPALDGG
jgi:hypothetical protein